jgi:hypothetical protein
MMDVRKFYIPRGAMNPTPSVFRIKPPKCKNLGLSILLSSMFKIKPVPPRAFHRTNLVAGIELGLKKHFSILELVFFKTISFLYLNT